MKSGREWNNEDKVQRQILWKRPNVDMGNKKEHDDLGTYMSQKHIQNPYFCPILKQWECACLLREGDNTVNKMYSRSKGWPGYLIFIQILDSTCDVGTAGGEHWIGKLTGDAINGYSGYKRHMYLAGILVTGREVGVKVYSGSEDSRMYENGVCCCYKGLKKISVSIVLINMWWKIWAIFCCMYVCESTWSSGIFIFYYLCILLQKCWRISVLVLCVSSHVRVAGMTFWVWSWLLCCHDSWSTWNNMVCLNSHEYAHIHICIKEENYLQTFTSLVRTLLTYHWRYGLS